MRDIYWGRGRRCTRYADWVQAIRRPDERAQDDARETPCTKYTRRSVRRGLGACATQSGDVRDAASETLPSGVQDVARKSTRARRLLGLARPPPGVTLIVGAQDAVRDTLVGGARDVVREKVAARDTAH